MFTSHISWDLKKGSLGISEWRSRIIEPGAPTMLVRLGSDGLAFLASFPRRKMDGGSELDSREGQQRANCSV
jgi:hypothetical protein